MSKFKKKFYLGFSFSKAKLQLKVYTHTFSESKFYLFQSKDFFRNSEIENGSTVKSETSSMCNVELIKQPTAEKLDVNKPSETVPVLKELAHSGLENPNFNMWNLSRDSIIDCLELV